MSLRTTLSSLAWQGMTQKVCHHWLPSFCAIKYCKSCSNCSYALEALLAAAMPIALPIDMCMSSVTAVG